MAKTYLSTVKYEAVVQFEITGVVDRHDIIGAVFGQSEGLLGETLDLRALQKNGKSGCKNGGTNGSERLENRRNENHNPGRRTGNAYRKKEPRAKTPQRA